MKRAAYSADPSVGDLLDGHRIEVVPLGASVPRGDHEIGLVMSTERCFITPKRVIPGSSSAQLVECLPVATEQAVQQRPPARVGERSKDFTTRLHDRSQYVTI